MLFIYLLVSGFITFVIWMNYDADEYQSNRKPFGKRIYPEFSDITDSTSLTKFGKLIMFSSRALFRFMVLPAFLSYILYSAVKTQMFKKDY